MAKIRVGIIGAGPRALNIIERIVWCLRQDLSLPAVDIHLIDPGEPCAGVHRSDQSRHLLTNTLASQVTMFSPVDPGDPLSEPSGPSFTEWADSDGYRRFGSDYRRSAGGERIGDLDYLPRALLGEYLMFAFRHIMERAPERLHVTHHRELAVDASEYPCFVELASGKRITCDAIVIATGHCETRPSKLDRARTDFVLTGRKINPRLDYMPSVYPTSRLADIVPETRVAIQGLGLTAYDAIAKLTAGRGGRFEEREGRVLYLPSGAEPKILLFSRQSLPYNARGVNQKGVDGGYQAKFLTVAAVDAIRARRVAELGDGRIDFEADILPLLRKDMAWAYRASSLGREPGIGGFAPSPEEESVIDRIFRPDHILASSSHAEFQARVIRHLEEDLDEAKRGNISSPTKAATDSIRDLRAGLAAAIEFGGLLPESHRYVCEHFIALTNRITFGPPLQRNAELIALHEAGILEWAGGRGAEAAFAPDGRCWEIRTQFPSGLHIAEADVLLIARVFGHRPEEDARGLSPQLVQRGIVRPFRNGDYHPHGLDVDRRMRVVGEDGTPSERIWAIGYVSEGPRFHTHALPRPRRASTQLSDAAKLVDDLLSAVGTCPGIQAEEPETLEEISS